jgi:hypothetical protein
VTESYLTDDDVSALEVLEAGGDLTDDQVGRLQALENTPFFAETIQQSEANSRRFAGAGFGPDGFVMSDASSPMVQAQPDPVPPTSGPVREDKPAQQAQAAQPDDGMRFDLVTPPPIDAVEMETNIRGPRLGAMGPVNESGDFFRDDEELLEALEAAPAKGIMLTREDFQTREELREKNSDTIGSLTTGAGNILSGLWQMAKGAAVEQGASPAAAIGQALGSAAFDPASAGKILVDGVKEASNRVVQAEVTKAEGARKAYIGVRQLWSWMDGTIENIEIDDDRRQAVRNDLINTGAFGQDNVANAQLLEAEVAKRKEQGLAPFAPTDKTAEYDIKYRRYWENEKLNRAYTGQNQYILDGRVVDEKPDIALSQPVTGFNPATGEQIQPLPYTSMLYGMAMQPDTYVGFGAGYFSKLRVMSRAAAASRPLFGGIELTAAKAAEAAKMGKDAQKFLRNSTIASGGLAATGLGMSFNDTTGTIGKGLLFFGGILPAMRATGYVLKRVPVANRFLEAGGILRPQALRIIAEESKAGPLGAGAAANTPATQAAAIRAARPESAARLAASGEVPQRYARFMGTKRTRQGDLNIQASGQRGFDSTLKRVAQNPENPANVRRAARTADELGLTQAFRATDDALGGAIAGVVGSAPFAAIAPDDQTAGGILAAGASLGAAGSMVSGFTSFRGDAVDADIARFMADTDALGGDTKALFQMPHKQLAAMSSLQGTASNKGVDVVALRTEDYNRMVPEAIGSQGYFSAPTAKDGSKAGRQRIFVDLGHSSLEEGTARITQAPDGMYELTVTRKDGSVAYPLPAADGSQPVIRRKSANDFTVKDGDPVSPYFPLNRQPPRIVTASHEFMHALMKSDMFGGDHQPVLRGLIYEQYKPDTIQSMAREYAQRLVDAQINNGRVPKPANDEAKAKMIDDMVTELDDASVASTGDRRAWIADEIVAETWQDIAQGIDVNRIRQGKSADGRVVDAARSAMIATTRALETFGMKFDWATGKPLTNPSTVFRDNPLATTPLLRKRILESVRNYDRYLTLLEDAGAVESKGAPLPRSGRAEDWLAEGTMRTHRKADGTMENDVMTVDPDGQVRWKEQSQIDNEYKGRSTAVSDLLKRLGTKLVDDNDPTFGLRRAGVGRTIYSGAELPMSDSPLGYPPVLAAFPEYYRTMYKDAVDSGRAGELVRFSNNTVGTRSDSGGAYQLSKLISSGYAKQSEGLFYGMQITKSGGHMNMQFVDMNAFKASALRAINDGKIPFFNNDYKEVVRNLKQLMDNYRNQRDGSYMIGDEGKNILNGLLYGKSSENKGWGAKLNARGSIRTYRMDRMNWIERTGDDGYFFDNDRAKNNRMPETEPVDGQAMPDTPQRVKMTEAAILNAKTGKVYTGPSHPQIYDSLPQDAFSGVPDDSDANFFMGDGWNSPEGLIDGFVDSSGKFYDREDAAAAVGSKEPLESVTGLQQRGQAMPDVVAQNYSAAQEATGGTLRPIAEQPENAPVVGRITPEQERSIKELDEYYRKVTPQRIKELRNDAIDSLANRLINKGIPVAEARGLATETYKKIKSRVAGASQVISGMGTSDLSRMAGTGRPAVATREGVNPNWLTSAFEAFDTDNDLALMKAQQVARQLNKEQQAQVAAGQNVDAARASGVRAATIDQGMKFVIGEKTADQKAFGSSLREDPAAPPRVYASVVEGQKFGSQGNYNVFFEWKKSAPIVITSHHHYGVGNGLTDIHASANIGDKNARSFGNPDAETYDTLPSGKKVLNTRLLVGNAGIDDIRAHQLMVSIPESSLSSLRSAYKTGKIGAVRQELNKTAVSQLVGSASQGKTQSFTSSEGVAPMVAIQRNRTEAYVLNPDLKNVASITIVSNSPKETALIKKNLAKAFENNGSSMPKIKVVSAESGASGNRGRSKITDEFFNLTGKVVYGAMLGGLAASQTDDNR